MEQVCLWDKNFPKWVNIFEKMLAESGSLDETVSKFYDMCTDSNIYPLYLIGNILKSLKKKRGEIRQILKKVQRVKINEVIELIYKKSEEEDLNDSNIRNNYS